MLQNQLEAMVNQLIKTFLDETLEYKAQNPNTEIAEYED